MPVLNVQINVRHAHRNNVCFVNKGMDLMGMGSARSVRWDIVDNVPKTKMFAIGASPDMGLKMENVKYVDLIVIVPIMWIFVITVGIITKEKSLKEEPVIGNVTTTGASIANNISYVNNAKLVMVCTQFSQVL